MSIDRFITDDFRVLAYLYDKQAPDGKAYVTQQEIADHLELNRATINKIIGELKSEEYIQQDGTHNGRYILNHKAVQIVTAFNNLNKNYNKEM